MNRAPADGRAQRLFFACWPDAADRERLQAVARPLLAGLRGKPVPPGRLHLTLAFLGAVAESRLPALLALGDSLAAGPLDWRFDRLEYWRGPRVLALVDSAPAAAGLALHHRLQEGLAGLGFPPETRPFRPHLTLARPVHAWLRGPDIEPLAWQSRNLALVESQSSAAGLEYRPLALWPAAGVAA